MTELREHAGDGGLGQIRALAYAMEPPAPGERSSILRSEAEEEWVARAQKGTVRALASAVRAAGGAVPEEDEPWDAVYLDIPRDLKPLAQRAFAAAGKIIGPTAPAWERLEGILQEFNAA